MDCKSLDGREILNKRGICHLAHELHTLKPLELHRWTGKCSSKSTKKKGERGKCRNCHWN